MRMTIGELRQVIKEEVMRSLREAGNVKYGGASPKRKENSWDELPRGRAYGGLPDRFTKPLGDPIHRVPSASEVAEDIGIPAEIIEKVSVNPEGTVFVRILLDYAGEYYDTYKKEPGGTWQGKMSGPISSSPWQEI